MPATPLTIRRAFDALEKANITDWESARNFALFKSRNGLLRHNTFIIWVTDGLGLMVGTTIIAKFPYHGGMEKIVR
jgi:hypothetical protein